MMPGCHFGECEGVHNVVVLNLQPFDGVDVVDDLLLGFLHRMGLAISDALFQCLVNVGRDGSFIGSQQGVAR